MAKVYFRLTDNDDTGTVSVKMVAEPPREEWDDADFTPSQRLALAAYAGMLDAGKVVRSAKSEEAAPEVTEVRSWDVGNN